MKILSMTSLGLALLAAPAFAESHMSGDPEAGENVFKRCKSCHMVVSDDGEEIQKGGKTGPNLYGIYQRQAGSVENFRYGDALVAAGEQGLKWEEADFVAYVGDPKGFLAEHLDDKKARSKMAFKLKSEEDAANVWAYLVSVGPEVEAGDAGEEAEEATN
ncbi:c-type cytochrome [Sulfitobacter aestuarii]|uniref:C-type cytochrome n=1 Tax=Sulfitobacter aestuarii TaxID=2161676 RepID=A0ABW5U414_9RHOB